MKRLTKQRALNKPDDYFTKLLDVVPKGLSRKETRKYLKEYKFISEGHHLHKDFISDYYYDPNTTPRPSTRVLYEAEKPFSATVWLVYPLDTNKFIAKKHRSMMSKKLDSVLEDKFGRPGTEKDLTFWHKGFTLVTKVFAEEKDGRLNIKIDVFSTKMFPVERIFEDYEKKKGLYQSS